MLVVWLKQTKAFLTKMGKRPSFTRTITSWFYFSEVSTLWSTIGLKSVQKNEQIIKSFQDISFKYSNCKLYRNIFIFKVIVSLDTLCKMLIMIVDDCVWKPTQ